MPRRRPIPKGMHYRVMSRDGWTCQYCGAHATCLDHISPVAAGGRNADDNLAAACDSCNARASDRVFESFEEKKRALVGELRDVSGFPAFVSRDDGYEGCLCVFCDPRRGEELATLRDRIPSKVE